MNRVLHTASSTSAAAGGIGLVLLAAVLWGTTGTAQSFAPDGASPLWTGALRLAAAACFFLVLMAMQRAWTTRPTAQQWRALAAAGACMAVYNLAFFAGVRATGVAAGTVLAIGSGPVWAGLLQWAAQGRAPRAAWWAGTALAVAGGAAITVSAAGASGDTGGAVAALDGAGVVLCLLAGLAYAVYTLVNKRLVGELPPTLATGASFGVAALLALPAAGLLAGEVPAFSGRYAAVVAWLGVAATGVSYLLFSHALRRISGATGVALALGEPVTAFVLAALVVGEAVTLQGAFGLVAVLAGLGGVIAAELAGDRGRVALRTPDRASVANANSSHL